MEQKLNQNIELNKKNEFPRKSIQDYNVYIEKKTLSEVETG